MKRKTAAAVSARITELQRISDKLFAERNNANEALLAISAALLGLTYNRFGKPETFNIPQEREAIRLLAVRYNVGPSQTLLEQIGKVARAATIPMGVQS